MAIDRINKQVEREPNTLRDGESVLVRAIIPANNPTYLTPAEVYRATRCGNDIHFRNLTRGSGTFESLTMLRAFARNNSVTFERVEDGQALEALQAEAKREQEARQ